jgi:predicted nucleic acid-binding protein
VTLACDTSVLVPALADWHSSHVTARQALRTVRAIPAHALLECFSTLTRLPHGQRFDPSAVGQALAALDRPVLSLTAHEHAGLVARCTNAGISGGAVYDALVGVTAQTHGATLLTRDKRARLTYEALGVAYSML